MPSYVITCKPDATDDQVQAVKDHAKEQGGKIGHEYSLIKGFAVSFPDDSVQSLAEHPHVENVEADSEVKIQ
ncbi:uncharacterized protein N7479_005725 [Penicillium vulpinum]|uniref:Inhibitor I9 domain-containing protein n=1 Tax=Penicillium vulpinum TaxID=29845 RepID=A0A1V6SET4_9EURO|nr:uncharacterized protein N7479_005725 [Penicillium vulpinum]KAJ5958575.1 hypothetical protein N7479_005725 [Penicillium vulpinum]OQE12103.1 hypothetical protein PENVUL_c001G01824 [Penicillium vulpinum]